MKKNIFKFSLILFTLFLSAFSLSCKSDFNEDIMYETVGNDLEKTPPAEVNNFAITSASQLVKLTWLNPTDKDFYGVKISVSSPNKNIKVPNDVTLMDTDITKIPTEYTFYELINDCEYTFNISTFDTNLNFSSGKSLATSPSANLSSYQIENAIVATGDGFVTLSWDNTIFTNFYGISIITTPAEGSAKEPILIKNDDPEKIPSTYTFYNLKNNITYQFIIQEFDKELNMSNATIITGMPKKDVNSLTVSDYEAISADSSVILSWQNPSSSNLYGLQLTATITGEGSLGTISKPIYFLGENLPTEYTITGLTNDVDYEFTINTLDQSLNLGNHPQSKHKTPAKAINSLRVTGLSTNSADGEITLNWTNPVNDNFFGLRINMTSESGNLGSLDKPVYFIGENIPSSYLVSGLTNDVQYNFNVYTLDKELNLSTTPAYIYGYPTKNPISQVLLRDTLLGDSTVTFNWENPNVEDLYGIKIVYYPTEDPSNSKQISYIKETGKSMQSSCSLTGLTNGTQYTINIYSINTDLYQSQPVPILATPKANENTNDIPSATAIPNDKKVTLTWTNPSNTDLYGVMIKAESEAQDASFGNLASPVYFFNENPSKIPTNYIAENLTNGVSYKFSIYTINQNMILSTPNSVSAIPTASTNTTEVKNLKINLLSSKVKLSWTNPDNTSNLSYYEITMSPPRTGENGIINITPTAGVFPTEYTVDGLENDRSYSFTLRTVDNATPANKSIGVDIYGTPNVGSSGLNSNPDLFDYKLDYKAYDFGYCSVPTTKSFIINSSSALDLTLGNSNPQSTGNGNFLITTDVNSVQSEEDYTITVTYTPTAYNPNNESTASWDEVTYLVGGVAENKIKFIASNFPQPKNVSTNTNELKLWLRADMIANKHLKNGNEPDKVKYFPDYSGNNFDALCSDNTTNKAPKFVLSDNEFAGNSVIDFSEQPYAQMIASGLPIVEGDKGHTTFVIFKLPNGDKQYSEQTIVSANYGSSYPVLRNIQRNYNDGGFYGSGDYKSGLCVKAAGMTGSNRWACISNDTEDERNRMLVTGAPSSATGLSNNDRVGQKLLSVCMTYNRNVQPTRINDSVKAAQLGLSNYYNYPSNIRMYVNNEERLLGYIESQSSTTNTKEYLNNSLISVNGLTTYGSYGKPWGDGKGHRFGILSDVSKASDINSTKYTDWLNIAQNTIRPYDKALNYNTPATQNAGQSGVATSGSATSYADYFENWALTDIWRNGTINTLTVGADFNTSGVCYSKIAEVIIFEGELSNSDIESVNNYIKYRYHVQSISTNLDDYDYPNMPR